MPLFRIVNGQLIMPDGCKSFVEVVTKYGVDRVGRTKRSEEMVVVADKDARFAVPADAIVKPYGTNAHFFRVINEDLGGKQEIVAWDDFGDKPDGDSRWVIIGSDRWSQLPLEKLLVRRFESPAAAISCLGENVIAMQEVEIVDGWRCVLAHRNTSLAEELTGLMETLQFIEYLRIPDGIRIQSLDDTDNDGEDRIFWTGAFPELEGCWDPDDEYCHINQVIVTPDGGIFICISIAEDRLDHEGAIKIFTRLFSHSEAKKYLTL